MIDQTVGQKTIGICDTQPVSAEGMRMVISDCPELEYIGRVDTLAEATAMVRTRHPNLMVVDKSLGMQTVLEWMLHLKAAVDLETDVILWGASISEAEALRFLQAGAKGIVRKTSDIPALTACLHAVAGGANWMADCVFRDHLRLEHNGHSHLTPREHQVMELVEQGLKNKEIARELGIRPGTVKIHLKHIFEKTGVRGRYGLALTAMKEKGLLESAHVN
jgi:two-component system nitrate/nitrite response regulator NarL